LSRLGNVLKQALAIALAAPSVAEGVNRFSVKDKAHFIEIAFGSMMEVSSQME
jgi:four helix bundle protein